MRQIADLHIHSKYSRACSRDLTLENIERTCRIKGVDIIATGDFTYPAWFESIKNELEEIPPTPFNKGGQRGIYILYHFRQNFFSNPNRRFFSGIVTYISEKIVIFSYFYFLDFFSSSG